MLRNSLLSHVGPDSEILHFTHKYISSKLIEISDKVNILLSKFIFCLYLIEILQNRTGLWKYPLVKTEKIGYTIKKSAKMKAAV